MSRGFASLLPWSGCRLQEICATTLSMRLTGRNPRPLGELMSAAVRDKRDKCGKSLLRAKDLYLLISSSLNGKFMTSAAL